MDKIRLGIIIGSTRPNRFADHPAAWIADMARAAGFDVDLLDLREISLPFFEETAPPVMAPPRHPIAQAWALRLAKCDAFIATAAEYNHAPTAVLKNAFDSAFVEWSRKLIAFVGYGGVGGARAIAHLRDIASALGMAPVSAGEHPVCGLHGGGPGQGNAREPAAYCGCWAKPAGRTWMVGAGPSRWSDTAQD